MGHTWRVPPCTFTLGSTRRSGEGIVHERDGVAQRLGCSHFRTVEHKGGTRLAFDSERLGGRRALPIRSALAAFRETRNFPTHVVNKAAAQ